MIYSLEEIKARVLPLVQKYHIPAIYLFGSYARGEAREDSDLDFLVDTAGSKLTSLLTLGALYCDLEDAFQKKIDLLTVRGVLAHSETPSDRNFQDVIFRERVRLDDVA